MAKMKLKIWIDNKDPYKTKKASMAAFMDTRSGGSYMTHAKHSEVLNNVYVTFLYGVGMPILFPLCTLNFLNQWICERMVIAKFMQLPPALDDSLMQMII